MITNPEQFAAKGDEWGALRDAPPPRRSWKRKVHPDGFVEYTVHEEEQAWCGPNPHVRPDVAPQEHGDSTRAVNPFHALILARKAKRDAEVVVRRNTVPFVPKRPENFQAPSEDDLRAKRMADTRRHMLVERRKVGLGWTFDHYCEIITLFGSWGAFEVAR